MSYSLQKAGIYVTKWHKELLQTSLKKEEPQSVEKIKQVSKSSVLIF